eukprot:g25420.t1
MARQPDTTLWDITGRPCRPMYKYKLLDRVQDYYYFHPEELAQDFDYKTEAEACRDLYQDFGYYEVYNERGKYNQWVFAYWEESEGESKESLYYYDREPMCPWCYTDLNS